MDETQEAKRTRYLVDTFEFLEIGPNRLMKISGKLKVQIKRPKIDEIAKPR